MFCRGTAVQGNGPKAAGAENTLKGIFAKATAQQSRPNQGTILKFCQYKFHLATFVDENDLEVVTVHLIFWSEGLSVNDGPLRPYSDPATLRFLEQIRREYFLAFLLQLDLYFKFRIIPDELEIDPNAAVDFKMTQVPDSSFDRAKQLEILKGDESAAKKKNPFSGNAEILGDLNNETITVNLEASIAENVTSTRIQLVLPNGSKKVITINPRAPISELYHLIQQE